MVVCRALVKRNGAEACIDPSVVVLQEQMKFDFNRFPHLQEAFDTLPSEIQTILKPSVIEIVPAIVDANK
jgi:hypothetical protein